MLLARRLAGGRSWGQAVRFDGSNDYLNRGTSLTGLSDGTSGTISFWFRPHQTYNASNAGGIICASGTGIDQGLYVVLANAIDGKLQIRASDSSTNAILDIRASMADLVTGSTYHVMASWVTGGNRRLYVNGGNVISTSVNTAGNIDWAGSGRGLAIGSFTNGSNKINADIGEFWFTPTYIDLSVEANRLKFRTAAGKPADLGRLGEKPTGSQPLVYFTGGAPSWNAGTNRGTGGAFTMSGAVAAATSFK
jgi:hypothetical protein